MDSTLKYRIIGAAVLLSLAIIFIPMILDGSGKEAVTTIEMEMPPQPTLIFSDEIEQRVQTPAPEHTVGQESEDTPLEIQPEENIMPEVTVDSSIKPELLSWVVQVGAFSEKEKAMGLQNKLLESGYDALVEIGENKGKEYYRVKVGPMISQDEAADLKQRLQKEFALESAFVTRYPPTEQ